MRHLDSFQRVSPSWSGQGASGPVASLQSLGGSEDELFAVRGGVSTAWWRLLPRPIWAARVRVFTYI